MCEYMVSAGGGGGRGGRRAIRSGQELSRVRCTEGVIETTAALPLWIHRPRARSAPCMGLLARHVLARVAGLGRRSDTWERARLRIPER